MSSNFITSAPLIGSYKNGNYTVQIYADGTKVRENDLDNFDAAFPENFDIKITNMCNNSCKFCFECSAPNGKHGDIMAPSFLDKLHKQCSYCAVAALVHCKSFSFPVAGVAQLTALFCNSSAVFFFPCPCSLEKFFSADCVPRWSTGVCLQATSQDHRHGVYNPLA